jgi:DNA-binding transcriptional regulator YhcF (GntR family)
MTPHAAILDIAPGDRLPIYRQIEARTREAIADGRLRSGDYLTPWQDVAEDLAVSPMAVKKAYRLLVSQGICAEEEGEHYRVEGPMRRQSPPIRELLPDRGELELARDIQTRLLPPRTIEGPGYRIAARSIPARFVGGDFYDVLRHGDGSVGIVVGDVAGKGLGASLIMASTKATLPFVAENRSVEGTLSTLGRRLHGELGPRDFVALAYARLDPGKGLARIAVAGLPNPLVLRQGQDPQEVKLPQPRLPLGVRKNLAYRGTEVKLEPGDRLLLYSDGIPESPCGDEELLGYEGLHRVLCHWHEKGARRPLDSWIDGLLSRLYEAAGRDPLSSDPLQDDWTALVLEAGSIHN